MACKNRKAQTTAIMSENSSKKARFRQSAKWKKFLHFKNVQQDGKCYITGKKLRKYAALHHLDLNAAHYEDISDPDKFIYVNSSIHSVIHDLWRYYKDDPTVLDRLKDILERMKEING